MPARCLKLALLFCVLALGPRAGAQKVFLETTFSGRVVDSLTREPLVSAIVSVVTQVDLSQYQGMRVNTYVTDEKGHFQFKCATRDRIRMEIAMLGYKPYVQELSMNAEYVNLGMIRMPMSAEEIDAVVVKARMQMYKMRGDTVVFIPRAVKTMKDDPAIEILRQMPGVEVLADGNIKILGRPVERTYVNEKLLFGMDPRTALQELDAEEVASIEAYDEVDEADAAVHGENARKRKVLNVVTFKKFSSSLASTVRGEMGTDFHEDADGERPVRYLVSADARFYKEGLQITAAGGSDNLTGAEIYNNADYQRSSNARAEVSGTSGRHNYGASYNYTGNVNRFRSASATDYFPTDYFASQHSQNAKSSETDADVHTLSGRYSYTGERSAIRTSLNAGFNKDSRREQSSGSTLRDGRLVSSNDITDGSSGDTYHFSWDASGEWRLKNDNSVSLDANIRHADGRMRGERFEQRIVEDEETPLGWRSHAPKSTTRGSFGGGYGLNLGKAGNIAFQSTVNYDQAPQRMRYTDIQSGEIDRLRSDDATEKDLRWEIGPHYTLRSKNNTFSVNLSYKLEHRQYDDLLAASAERRDYHFIVGGISYWYSKSGTDIRLDLSNDYYSVNSKYFSSRIDDTNPLYVSVGNPALAPQKKYTFSTNVYFMRNENSSWSIHFDPALVTDPVLLKRHFFEEAQTLPQYGDYRMPAGASLTRPENGAAYLDILGGAHFKTRIAPLKLFLDMRLDYRFSNPQQTQYEKTERMKRHGIDLRTSITSNFSSKIRITVNNQAGWDFQRSFGNAAREFRDELSTILEWDVIDNLFLKADYIGIFNADSGPFPLENSHRLNLSVGCRMLNSRARFAFNAYDVLNDFAQIRITQNAQAVSRSVSYIGANYFTFSFEYRFKNRN